jgi:hypothetical protein
LYHTRSEKTSAFCLNNREISFEALLPNQRYPFAIYTDGIYRPASYYLELLEGFMVPLRLLLVSLGLTVGWIPLERLL